MTVLAARRVRVPLPPGVPARVTLPARLALRLTWWRAVHGWSRQWWH